MFEKPFKNTHNHESELSRRKVNKSEGKSISLVFRCSFFLLVLALIVSAPSCNRQHIHRRVRKVGAVRLWFGAGYGCGRRAVVFAQAKG